MTDAEKYTELRDRVLTMDKRFGHFAALHRPDDEGSPTVLLAELSHLVHQAAYWCREHPPTPTFRVGDRVRILMDEDHDVPDLNLRGYTAVITDPPSGKDDTVEIEYDPPLPKEIVAVLDNRSLSTQLNYYAPEELELVERKETRNEATPHRRREH